MNESGPRRPISQAARPHVALVSSRRPFVPAPTARRYADRSAGTVVLVMIVITTAVSLYDLYLLLSLRG